TLAFAVVVPNIPREQVKSLWQQIHWMDIIGSEEDGDGYTYSVRFSFFFLSQTAVIKQWGVAKLAAAISDYDKVVAADSLKNRFHDSNTCRKMKELVDQATIMLTLLPPISSTQENAAAKNEVPAVEPVQSVPTTPPPVSKAKKTPRILPPKAYVSDKNYAKASNKLCEFDYLSNLIIKAIFVPEPIPTLKELCEQTLRDLKSDRQLKTLQNECSKHPAIQKLYKDAKERPPVGSQKFKKWVKKLKITNAIFQQALIQCNEADLEQTEEPQIIKSGKKKVLESSNTSLSTDNG
ncbi:MAG: hypothetical protein ACRC2T_20655, partial [Thermoguttaceae bacterium]